MGYDVLSEQGLLCVLIFLFPGLVGGCPHLLPSRVDIQDIISGGPLGAMSKWIERLGRLFLRIECSLLNVCLSDVDWRCL